MNNILEKMGASRGGDGGPRWTRDGESVVLDCRSCRLVPVVHSPECIRCMVFALCELGGTERVILRTGRDTEVSGLAARALRDLASVRRWSYPQEGTRRACGRCAVSRRAVMDAVWEAFPLDPVAAGRGLLSEGGPDRSGCPECMARTSAALDQVEAGLNRVVTEVSSPSGTGGP